MFSLSSLFGMFRVEIGGCLKGLAHCVRSRASCEEKIFMDHWIHLGKEFSWIIEGQTFLPPCGPGSSLVRCLVKGDILGKAILSSVDPGATSEEKFSSVKRGSAVSP